MMKDHTKALDPPSHRHYLFEDPSVRLDNVLK